MEILVSADVELAAIADLSTGLPLHGWPGLTLAANRVGTKIPSGSPESFVRLRALGGVNRDLIADAATLVVEGYHQKEGKARELCAMSTALLEAAGRAGVLGGLTCYGVSVAALPGNLPDPNVPDRFRFTSTISVSLRKLTA